MSKSDQELTRDLSFLEAYTIGLGTMIGAGIFVLPSIAARRAAEFASTDHDGSLTFLNVQEPADGDEELEKKGRDVIETLVERASLQDVEYSSRVVVSDDVEAAILDVVDEFDTICVGATRSGAVSQALFGSIPETIGEQAEGTVAMVRGPEVSPMSISEALVVSL